MKAKDLTGQKFGRLTVIARNGSNPRKQALWKCECECGNYTTVEGSKLKTGHTQSCGCLHKEILKQPRKHGLTYTKLYRIYRAIIDRTEYESNKSYKDYGARGIKMCYEWRNDFSAFYNWAITNGYTDTLTIDRIDVNGNYEPNNCRWVTRTEQANNKRNNRLITYNGKTQTMAQWSRQTGISYTILSQRINKNKISIGKALGYE